MLSYGDYKAWQMIGKFLIKKYNIYRFFVFVIYKYEKISFYIITDSGFLLMAR